MATKKTPTEEKFEKQDFELFPALAALDNKDYDYLERMTEDQKKKFVPYMMTHWMSSISASADVQGYYVMSVNHHANTNMFNEYVQKHPDLQWKMLCASSAGIGKFRHNWIPHLSSKVSQLKESPKKDDVYDYYKKIYPKASDSDLKTISEVFVTDHKKKVYLAKTYPNLKQSDIELLAQLVTDEDIAQYERDKGN